MTKKKHEHLVEEMAKKAIEFYHPYPSSIPLESDRDFIRGFITLILSAVRDGLELPDEVGRWKWPTLKDPNEGITAWTGDMLRTGNEVFIALRPLAGTGKEKEK